MSAFNKIIRSTSRQLVILIGVIGLTFAAGLDWAQAAETVAGPADEMPSELHVIVLFLLTLGVLAASIMKPKERAKVRGRGRRPRSPRR